MLPTKAEIQQKMSEFRGELKISALKIPSEIEEILSASREKLKNSPREDLCIDAIRLSQYGLYLKSESNRLKSNMSWCNANINSIVGRETLNTEGYGLKEKSLVIIRNDPVARDLEGIRSLCEVQILAIDDLDRKVDFMSSCIKNLAFERRGA
jgi:hypothetical protein